MKLYANIDTDLLNVKLSFKTVVKDFVEAYPFFPWLFTFI